MPMRKTIKSNLLGKHAQLSTNLLFNLKILFQVLQFSPSTLFIGVTAETSNLMTVSGIFQPECR